jgi:hexosaminidase
MWLVRENFWRHYFAGAQTEYMTYPRASALSEVQWWGEKAREYGDYLSRLPVLLQRMDVMEVNYRPKN